MLKTIKVVLVLLFMYGCQTRRSPNVESTRCRTSESQPVNVQQYVIKKQWTGCNNTGENERQLSIYF